MSRMLAVVGAQVLIGQWCGSNSVSIKRAVDINSLELRAMKKILMQKGLTVPKVAALVGGPEYVSLI
jgi:hypothetical protein